jgi:hypothetical protein
MAELLEEQRESWGTRGGFILAAVGSAVGLGNLWGFPYKLYSFGGGAFLIPYIVALLVIGVPIMILEFSIGHYTQRAAPDAFKRGHKRFEMVGWWGIVLAFVIITYYPVILAYCFSFLWYSIVGIVNGGELPWAGEGMEGVENAKRFFNETYLGKIDIEDARFYLGSIRWNLVLPLAITWVTMYFCIFRGVRLVGKIVWLTVPLPWLMLAILTVRGLTLEGSMQGLAYYLDPVWSELTKPVTWRYAIGQVFFSLSLAYGIMVALCYRTGILLTVSRIRHNDYLLQLPSQEKRPQQQRSHHQYRRLRYQLRSGTGGICYARRDGLRNSADGQSGRRRASSRYRAFAGFRGVPVRVGAIALLGVVQLYFLLRACDVRRRFGLFNDRIDPGEHRGQNRMAQVHCSTGAYTRRVSIRAVLYYRGRL